MNSINSILERLTDPKCILRQVRESLEAWDPAFPQEEARFKQAVAALEAELGTGAEAYLDALERELASDLIFAGWQGFRYNLDCFNDPVHKLLLGDGFEELIQEQRMPTLPMARTARAAVSAFLAALPPEKKHLTEDITDYYAYLQTFAYKQAHFFGYQLADRFLPYVIPGYVCDPVTTARYSSLLNSPTSNYSPK